MKETEGEEQQLVLYRVEGIDAEVQTNRRRIDPLVENKEPRALQIVEGNAVQWDEGEEVRNHLEAGCAVRDSAKGRCRVLETGEIVEVEEVCLEEEEEVDTGL